MIMMRQRPVDKVSVAGWRLGDNECDALGAWKRGECSRTEAVKQ